VVYVTIVQSFSQLSSDKKRCVSRQVDSRLENEERRSRAFFTASSLGRVVIAPASLGDALFRRLAPDVTQNTAVFFIHATSQRSLGTTAVPSCSAIIIRKSITGGC
jgi:hypothetical protein